MRAILWIFILLNLVGCGTQKRGGVIVVPIDRESVTVDINSIQSSNRFSQEFLDFLVLKFPAASAVIFHSDIDSHKFVTLSDTAYTFGAISGRNRLAVINSLPKDLSKEESGSYFSKPGFYAFIDSADKARQDSVFDERIKWTKASSAIEKEYLRFYSMARNFKQDYLIIVSKSSINGAPW